MTTTFRITRRAALLGAAGALAAPAVLRAQSPVRLTLGHGAAPGNPRSVAAERFAAQLREKSNGRVEMRVAGSAQLGDDAAMLTAASTSLASFSSITTTRVSARPDVTPPPVRRSAAKALTTAVPVVSQSVVITGASSYDRRGRASRDRP